MKLKQLEGLLGSLEQFSSPKIELEQYPTGPHIASRMLFTAENSFGDVADKVVADFGCGCGTLGLAAALLGAQHVVGVDIDTDSLETASENADDLELDMELVQCDIRNLRWQGQVIDTIVMNPPFGTRTKGADMDFLSMALKIASGAVYSLHKTSTRDHVKRHCETIMQSVLKFYVSFGLTSHRCTNFIRERKLILLWTFGVLFLESLKHKKKLKYMEATNCTCEVDIVFL